MGGEVAGVWVGGFGETAMRFGKRMRRGVEEKRCKVNVWDINLPARFERHAFSVQYGDSCELVRRKPASMKVGAAIEDYAQQYIVLSLS